MRQLKKKESGLAFVCALAYISDQWPEPNTHSAMKRKLNQTETQKVIEAAPPKPRSNNVSMKNKSRRCLTFQWGPCLFAALIISPHAGLYQGALSDPLPRFCFGGLRLTRHCTPLHWLNALTIKLMFCFGLLLCSTANGLAKQSRLVQNCICQWTSGEERGTSLSDGGDVSASAFFSFLLIYTAAPFTAFEKCAYFTTQSPLLSGRVPPRSGTRRGIPPSERPTKAKRLRHKAAVMGHMINDWIIKEDAPSSSPQTFRPPLCVTWLFPFVAVRRKLIFF